MKSVVEVDVDVPRERLAALFADPSNITSWMEDVARYEPLSGTPGMPGSTYRLVPKKGKMVFVATVLSKDLPNESRLHFDASNVTVSIAARFIPGSPSTTRLISEEIFRFKGPVHALLGLVASGAIRKAHRKHIEAFKRFAERRNS